MNVAVVGGGIFGVTAAVRLAQEGHRVELFERGRDLLTAASGINQYRLHRGYHYPRSPQTARDCQDSEASFMAEYGQAVLAGNAHYYAIVKTGSLVSPSAYLAFCREQGLACRRAWPRILYRGALALCVRVRERLLDMEAIRALCSARLRREEVVVRLNTEAAPAMLERHDASILATYATINPLLARVPESQLDYQYELCEKPVLRLPVAYRHQSVVIMDGPFMCIDPFGRTGLFVMGNVVHAIHQTNVGRVPDIDPAYRPLLNAGVIRRPPVTRIERFLAAAREFFHGVERAEHVGSMFTIRTVLPGKEATDERPTIVRRVSERLITVFSGKIGTCAQAASEVAALVRTIPPKPRRRRVPLAVNPAPRPDGRGVSVGRGEGA